jgi:hypothetical protein
MTSRSTFGAALAFWKGAALFVVFASSSEAILRAQLIPIGPFSGSAAETFESFQSGFTNAPLVIMGGAASVQSTVGAVTIPEPGNYNFSLGSSSASAAFGSVVAADGGKLLGFEDSSAGATMNVVFTNAVKAFGGYWGAGTIAGSPATLSFTFYDAADVQIGSPQTVSYVRLQGDGQMEWHGWFSSIPFKRVKVTCVTINTMVMDSFRAGAMGFSVLTSIAPLNATQWMLQGNGTTGVVYTVQGNTNLAGTNWVTLGTAPADVTGAVKFTNTSTSLQRFYRLQAP